MPKRELKNITVNYISLVRAGANKKTIIYKGSDTPPTWNKEVAIAKQEEGIVYGIVYSPGETDTQGDITTKEEIKKAAYNFLKQKKVDNIDKNHSFKKEGAYVCESWLIRKADPLFPKEKEGSWAVGIKIESEELKKEIKEGKIKAISMAGEAEVKEIEKANSTIEDFINELKSIFRSVSLNISGNYYNQNLEKGEQMPKPNEEKEESKTKDIEKEDLAQILKDALTPLKEELKKSIQDELKKEAEQREKLETEVKELKEALQKSQQNQTPATKKAEKKQDSVLA